MALWVFGDLSINQRHEMIETAEGGGNQLQLLGWLNPVETGEESTAGIQISDDIGRWLQSRGRIQPFEEARFEVLEHGNFANILACRKPERSPYLLQARHELVTIKSHSGSSCRFSRCLSVGG
jgi:hypothetical protein